MIATDFIFNGQNASDYGLIICSFDGELQSASGGEVEFEIVKPPGSNKYTFYGAHYNTVLEWNFSVMKKLCDYNDVYEFSNEEIRDISNWLEQEDGYHWFMFCQENDGEDIYYEVQIDVAPHQVGGRTIGFDLKVTSNSAFGYSSLHKKKKTIKNEDPLVIYIDNDTRSYLLPVVKITGSGDFSICNESDIVRMSKQKVSTFVDVDTDIYMDSENEIIDGVSPNNFNWNFLRLVNDKNVISTDSSDGITIEIEYREVRRVVV